VRTGSLRDAWRMLRARPDRVLVPTIALSVPAIAVHVLLQYLVGTGVAGSHDCPRTFAGATFAVPCGPTDVRTQQAFVIGMFCFFVVGQLVAAGLYRATLDAVDDVPVRGPYAGWSIARALPAALLVALLLTLGVMFLLLPAVLVGFFTRYVMAFVVDRGLGAGAALRASVVLVGSRFGRELGFVALAVPVLLLGALVLGIGLYVAIPVVMLAQAARYRAAHPREAAS
jgi:uncharacterized membrane protein